MATAASSYLPDGTQTAPSVAATLLFVINIMRKVSCTLPSWFHSWRGEKAQGSSPLLQWVSSLLTQPLPLPNVAEQAVGRWGPAECFYLYWLF